MSEQWTSVAEAAAYLKVHPRTIERRINSGKLQSRRADDGQVQVCVEAPDPVEPTGPDALETVKELADRQVDIAAGSASAIVRIAHDAAERANTDLVIARQELTVARRSGRAAWVAVGVLATLLPIAVMAMLNWGVRSLAEERANVRLLSTQLDQTRGDLAGAFDDRDAARRQRDDARLAAARLEGEVAAYKDKVEDLVRDDLARREEHARQARYADRPTTRPASLLDRVAQLFVNE